MALPPISALPTAPSRGMDANTFNSAADGFLGALPTFRSELNAFGAAVVADAVASSAVANYNATSATSLAIAAGSKTFAIQTGKLFVVGQYVQAASAADPTKWMHGLVTAHNSGTGSLTISVDLVGTGGTVNDWVIGLSGPVPTLGWQTIATIPTTSGGTFDFTGIPNSFSDLLLLFAGVSHNSGTSAGLNFNLGDGVTLSSGGPVTNAMSASGAWRGSLHIPGYNEDQGYVFGGVETLTATPGQASPLSPLRNWYVAGGIKALRLSLTVGTGDLGSLILKGRK